MKKVNRFEVEEPDASIEIILFGNTLAWIFLFDTELDMQTGVAAVSNPEHATLALALVEGAVQLLSNADWQNILPFDDRADRWQVTKKKTPSEDGEFNMGGVIPTDDLPF